MSNEVARSSGVPPTIRRNAGRHTRLATARRRASGVRVVSARRTRPTYATVVVCGPEHGVARRRVMGERVCRAVIRWHWPP